MLLLYIWMVWSSGKRKIHALEILKVLLVEKKISMKFCNSNSLSIGVAFVGDLSSDERHVDTIE